MRVLLAILVLAGSWTARAQGTSEAIHSVLKPDPPIQGSFVGTAGWSFQLVTNVTVTELGCMVDFYASNPTTNLVQVGLWGPTGLLLASNAVGPSSTLFDQSLYSSVTPVALSPNQTYHIGVSFFGAQYFLNAIVPTLGGSVSTSADITGVGAGEATSGFGSPSSPQGLDGSMYVGANFRYTGGVPEPSSGALVVLGALLLAVRRRGGTR
jgi:hypothetical protein